MSDLTMFLVLGGVLGVLALMCAAMWMLMLHKSHTEWRLSADNGRLASPFSNDATADAPAHATGAAELSRPTSWRHASQRVR
jgi:hypothetical protein